MSVVNANIADLKLVDKRSSRVCSTDVAVAVHRVLEIDRPRERILLDTSAVNIDGLGLEVGYADAASVALSLSVLDQPALESVRLFRVDGPQEARMNAAALVDLVPGTSAEAPFSFFVFSPSSEKYIHMT